MRPKKNNDVQLSLFDVVAVNIDRSEKISVKVESTPPTVHNGWFAGREKGKTIIEDKDGNTKEISRDLAPDEYAHLGISGFLTEEELKLFEGIHDNRPYFHPLTGQTGTQAGNAGGTDRNEAAAATRDEDFGSLGTEHAGATQGTGSDGILQIHADSSVPADNRGERAGNRHGDGNGGEWVLNGGNSERPSGHKLVNYKIRVTDNVGKGEPLQKIQDNLVAIKTLHSLIERNEQHATDEEKSKLVKYVGWEGLAQIFDQRSTQWLKEKEELAALLSPEQYDEAKRSTLSAFYTSPAVIQGIYAGLQKIIGRQNLTLETLEPSCGIGHFIGLAPKQLNLNFIGVELDSTSANIAKFLYPQATIINDAFQTIQNGREFDLIVGNPPFGDYSVFDENFPKLGKMSVHNYFIAKSMSLLREGGIAAFVVSRYFLDSTHGAAREFVASQADLLGAIRLPSSTFWENARTRVNTDIVFFKKHNGNPQYDQDWLKLTSKKFQFQSGKEEEHPINNYFIKNEGQIAGNLALAFSNYGAIINCEEIKNTDIQTEIEKRIEILPENIFQPKINAKIRPDRKNHDFIQSEYFRNLPDESFALEPFSHNIVIKNKNFWGSVTKDNIGQKIRSFDDYIPYEVKNKITRARIISMIQIRDTLRKLINEEKKIDGNPELEASLRMSLNYQYDNFVSKFGFLNSSANKSALREDAQYALVMSLETNYDKGLSDAEALKSGTIPRPASAKKADIFSKKVILQHENTRFADSPKDALIISLRETGDIDLKLMAKLLNTQEEEIIKTLQKDELIFFNPENEKWETREKYLSGNVKEKLEIARQKKFDFENINMDQNIKSLESVQPAMVTAADIGLKFGTTWIPDKFYVDFIKYLDNNSNLNNTKIKYLPESGTWLTNIEITTFYNRNEIYGTPKYNAVKILDALFNNRQIVVKDEDENIIQDITTLANQKAERIKLEFLDWIWRDDERRRELEDFYNNKFNTNRPPVYDGSHLTLSGANPAITLRPHQKNAIWRGIQEGGGLFDHVVGAGKTMVGISIIMEQRRMGLLHKPMVVVPNHLLYQWRNDFFKLYPDAKILIAEKTDLTKENRNRLFGRIATGDWDAVIIAHSSFGHISAPKETQKEILKQQIDDLTRVIENEENNYSVKRIQNKLQKMQSKYDELVSKIKKDRMLDFSDLGIDALFVDESQEFKNLFFTTNMQISGLGNPSGSAKAFDLFIKCRYLQEKNGKGVYFLTGTPIANTIAEVFTLQRYLQYDELSKKNLQHFDAWASTFGQIKNNWELDATGVNYKIVSRFSKFQNIPELLNMYRSFADVITKSDLTKQAKDNGLPFFVPEMENGKPDNIVAERSPMQAEYMNIIINRMLNLPKDPRIDNPLKITNDARKAGLDFRIINPGSEDFELSKINLCAQNIFEIWKDTEEKRGTQLVFCDISTPKKKNGTDYLSIAAKTVLDDKIEPSDPENDEEKSDDEPCMDEIISLGGNEKFSVYNDLKEKLIQKGIPEHEISFIHDANTDLRKIKLFEDMNEGRCRILIGSTFKMGAGMNVQKRLVAAHHLDAPWRPSDIEQRNGRILRQGNKFFEEEGANFKVKIFNYATNRTYDARMWQTIEYKASAIEQFRRGDVLQRELDDISNEAASAAEMKAAASGNPLILHEVKLAGRLRELEMEYSQFKKMQFRLKDRKLWLKDTEQRFEKAKEIYKMDSLLRDIHINDESEIKIEFQNENNFLTINNPEQIKNHLLEGISLLTSDSANKKFKFGQYKGFTILIERQDIAKFCSFQFLIKGDSEYEYRPRELFFEGNEKITIRKLYGRLDKFLEEGIERKFKNHCQTYEEEKSEIKKIDEELGKKFEHQDELTLTQMNHEEVISELKKMQKDSSYISTWTPRTKLAGTEKTGTKQKFTC